MRNNKLNIPYKHKETGEVQLLQSYRDENRGGFGNKSDPVYVIVDLSNWEKVDG